MKQLDCPDSSILLVIVLVGLGLRSFRIFQDHQQDGPNVLNWSELSNTWKIWKAFKHFKALPKAATADLLEASLFHFVPGYYGYAVGSHLIQSVYHTRQQRIEYPAMKMRRTSVEHRSEKRRSTRAQGFSTKWNVSAESRKTSSNEGPKNNSSCAQKDFKKKSFFKSIHAGKWTFRKWITGRCHSCMLRAKSRRVTGIATSWASGALNGLCEALHCLEPIMRCKLEKATNSKGKQASA